MKKIIFLIALVLLAVPIHAQYELTVDANTTALWHFNQTTSEDVIIDETGNYNMEGHTVTFVAGILNNSIDFRGGTSSYANTSGLLDTWTENGSIEFYFKPDTTIGTSHSEYGLIMKQNIAETNEMEIYFPTNQNYLRASMRSTAGGLVTINSTARTWHTTKWYKVTFNWGKGGLELYIDGVLEANSTSTAVPSAGTNGNFSIGRGISAGMNMKIDEMRVSNQARNPVPTNLLMTFSVEEFLSNVYGVNITIENDDFQESWYNLNATYSTTTNGRGDFTLTATSNYGIRRYYITITEGQDTVVPIWFPISGNYYTFVLRDENTNALLSGVQIDMWRFFNDSNNLVGQAKTQSDGTAVVLANPSVFYSLYFTKSGCSSATESQYSFSPIYSDPITYKLNCGAGSVSESVYLPFILNTVYWCTNTSSTLTCWVNNSNGLLYSTELVVKKQNYLSWDSVCDIINYSNPSNTTCSLGDTTNATYWYYVQATIPSETTTLINALLSFGGKVVNYGVAGLFLAFAIIITMFFIGSFNPSASMYMTAMGIVFTYLLRLLPIPPVAVVSVVLVLVTVGYMVKT